VLRGISRLNIRDSYFTNVCVPLGLVEAAMDPSMTTAMTIEYVAFGQLKKMSLYLYLMDDVKDAPFVDTWIPRPTAEYSHNIDGTYHNSDNGFVWADLQHVCQRPKNPAPPSSQPLVPFLEDIFSTQGDQIMSRVAHMVSSRYSTSGPPAQHMSGTPPSRAAPSPMHAPMPPQAHAVAVPVDAAGRPMSGNYDTGNYRSSNRFTDPVSDIVTPHAYDRGGGSSDPIMAQVVSVDPPLSRGDGGYGTRGHSHGAGSSMGGTSPRAQVNQTRPHITQPFSVPQQQTPLHQVADESRTVSAISAENDYTGYTLTQLETSILSNEVSEETVISLLMRSEVHTRVLKSTIRGGHSDEDMRQLYARLLAKGGRGKFVTFLRVQCQIFGAMHDV
jgi:hypothetical protein